MKFSCRTATLQHALGIVSRAASTRNLLHILGGILLEASGKELKLTATNLEMGIEYTIEADIEIPGSVVLPASVFHDIVKKSPGETMFIEVDTSKHKAKISCSSFKMELAGLASADYPELELGSGASKTVLPTKGLVRLLNKTLYAVASDDIRPIFTGALFVLEDQCLTTSGTDGFRIASAQMECEYQGEVQRLVVPGKNCLELSRLLSSTKVEEVELSILRNQLVFEFAGVRFVTKLIEGQYPQLKTFLPKDYHTEFIVSNSQLKESLERASLIIRDNQTGVVHLSFNKDKLTVLGKSNELGQHIENVDIATLKGEETKVSFTLRYVIDLLKNMDSENCIFRLAESYNLLVVRPEKEEDSFALLMPVTSDN